MHKFKAFLSKKQAYKRVVKDHSVWRIFLQLRDQNVLLMFQNQENDPDTETEHIAKAQ